MTVHIDLYSAKGGIPGHWEFTARQFEGAEAVEYWMRWKDVEAHAFPYFNGYTLQTPLHDDGECEQHRPPDPVWERASLSDGPDFSNGESIWPDSDA